MSSTLPRGPFEGRGMLLSHPRTVVGVVGAGMMGLSLAYFLQQRGYDVELFEREEQAGGLSTYHDFGPFVWDRFYHCILPADKELIGLVQGLGLHDSLRWNVTKTGFFVDETLYSLSNALEFLRFPAISLVDRLRLAYTVHACSRIRDWRELEAEPVGEWLGRLGGRHNFEKIWKPLLRAKYGDAYERASAVNIWATIRRMFSARHDGLKKESLGYVTGGYRTILQRMQERLEAGGARVHCGVQVQDAYRARNKWVLETDQGAETVDQLVFTTPTGLTQRILGRPLPAAGPETAGAKVEYVGIVCLVLLLRRRLSPFYLVNIADSEVPFTGVIEMTNLTTTSETAGRHLVYVPKYAAPDDPLHKMSPDELLQRFIPGLRKMFGCFVESEIEAVHVVRAPYVQPLQVCHYAGNVPTLTGDEEGLYVVNTSQLTASNLNNNEVVRHARRAAELF